MGQKLSKKNIKVKNFISRRTLLENPHLNVCSEIVIGFNKFLRIPEIDIRMDGCFPHVVYLSPDDCDEMSPISPIVSSDSSYDTVN